MGDIKMQKHDVAIQFPKDEIENLTNTIFKIIFSRGIGSISKSEYEQLFFWVIFNFGTDHSGNKISEKKYSEISNILKINERKIQTLRTESNIKYLANINDYYVAKFLDYINKVLFDKESKGRKILNEEGEIKINLSDRGLLDFVKVHLRQENIDFNNTNFNSIINIKFDDLKRLLVHFGNIISTDSSVKEAINSISAADSIEKMQQLSKSALKKSGEVLKDLVTAYLTTSFTR
jgi:hypothetical protein